MSEFIDKISKIQAEVIEKAITIADEYELERDKVLNLLAGCLAEAVLVGDYSKYKTKAQMEADNG